MPAAQPPWLVTVRGVDDNPRSGMQECALVSRREQAVLGDAGCWWSGGDERRGIVCGKGLATMKAGEGHRTVHQAEAGNPAIERLCRGRGMSWSAVR